MPRSNAPPRDHWPGAISPEISNGAAVVLLIVSLAVVLSLPPASLAICVALAVLALPQSCSTSAKRWFAFPQLVLAICWGFAVLIPWAASEASLEASGPLLCCWLATVVWTFGFDTVYAMADRRDDAALGLRSSALSLGASVVPAVRLSYGLSCGLIAVAGHLAGLGMTFWPIWAVVTLLMQRSCRVIQQFCGHSVFGRHFLQQAQLQP